MALAVLDFVDLAMRCLGAAQRGRTSLANKDAKILRDIAKKLQRHRHAVPLKQVRRKVPILSPDMKTLGNLRFWLDDICSTAASRPPSEERDQNIAERIQWVFETHEAAFGVGRQQIDDAVYTLRSRVSRRLRMEEEPGAERDWLKAAKRNDNRNSPRTAAGELLRLIVKNAPHPPSAGLSVSSTAEYVKRNAEQGDQGRRRTVFANQRLTYLMTVLGVPLEEAPWVAFQVGKLITGEPMWKSRLSRAFRLRLPNPKAPEPFRYFKCGEEEATLFEFRRRLIAAGYPKRGIPDEAALAEFKQRTQLRIPLSWFRRAALWNLYLIPVADEAVSGMPESK